MSSAQRSVACMVPTFNGGADARRLFDSLAGQSLAADLFVMDSDSQDGTASLASGYARQVTSIPKKQFDHGGTRQALVSAHPGYAFYVFLTQDAWMADSHALEKILEPFVDPRVGAVCGRQLPHLDANPFARHARLFNYPDEVQTRSMADAPKVGLKTAFISNSFAAWRAEALGDVGGFPRGIIFGEDMWVAAKLLLSGWRIAYAGEACCHHSHNYTVGEEFRRYFDIGVFHAREAWLRQAFGKAEGEGLRFLESEARYLLKHSPALLPAMVLRNGMKWLAYKLGLREKHLPLWLKRRMGMNRGYWRSA